jgi:hypothetical protein
MTQELTEKDKDLLRLFEKICDEEDEQKEKNAKSKKGKWYDNLARWDRNST